jgi:hypothetical protein
MTHVPSHVPGRTVHAGDAIAWLAQACVVQKQSVVTSLPDVSEVPLDFTAWRTWFVDAAVRTLRAIDDDQVAVFYQTDIKHEGRWIDKGHMVHTAADVVGAHLLFHKVICRRPAGSITFGRPAYAHLLAFSRACTVDAGHATPDVVTHPGTMTWPRAIPLHACTSAVQFARDHAGATSILDPFCGVGTVLAVANACGLDAVGVELTHKRVLQARTLVVPVASRS